MAVLSVGALTNLIKNSLETSFSSVSVEGEVSGAKISSSGHLYFSLKDRDALIQAVMFKFRLSGLDFELVDGIKVIARGGVSVYAARGQYQLIVQSMKKAGIGDILAMLEERKQRLSAEGLFDQANKKPLPAYPSRVAVVTSPSGAAIRDIINVLSRRNAGIDVLLLPAPVQGDEAAGIIAARIRQANRLRLADVLIVGRGGGSPEDLLAFSDEEVVRAIAASDIPVISAVGHEIDWALSDFAADLRAPTPSAAAELVAESREILLSEVEQFGGALKSSILARIEYARLSLSAFSPEDVETRFMRILMPIARRSDDARDELSAGMKYRLLKTAHRIELCDSNMELASPEAVLRRGYSIVRRKVPTEAWTSGTRDFPLGLGEIVRSGSVLSADETLQIVFSSGKARGEVRAVRE
ncbi:MAG: exodeoxyribonuclease VII large subunit [Rectinemataceae bacterium]